MIDVGNTLYVTTPGAALRLDHDTVRVETDGTTALRVPLLRLSAIVCFASISISPSLIERCAEDGRSIVLLDRNGRFRARIEGPTKGNVLLRRAQHAALSDAEAPVRIARQIAELPLIPHLHRRFVAAALLADTHALGVIAISAERRGAGGADPFITALVALLLLREALAQGFHQLLEAAEGLDLRLLLLGQ